MRWLAQWIAEQTDDISRFAYRIVPNWGGLRSAFRVISSQFFPAAPRYDKTVINYDLARQLYRNDGGDSHLGGGFCKPIIDRSVEYMGIPSVTVGDEEIDNDLNDAIQTHWKPQLIEVFRNAMRDSKTVVRIYQPDFRNPLVTEEEHEACRLEVVDPERVTFVRNPRDPDLYDKAVIIYKVEWPDDETQPLPDPQRGSRPQVKEHEIWEIITPDSFKYYDKTDNQYLTSWGSDNNYGFVPLIEIWNEYDSSLGGGQSDLESVYPFVKAFHETFMDALKAHKYHSIPKLKFKVADMVGFFKNNFPDTIDDNGQPIPGSSIKWRGREVLFMREDEDMEFIQMVSILGDSKTLLEFLVDCISIASQTPEWAFMRVEGGTSQGNLNAQTEPFIKKIERKRNNFQPFIQMLCKMHLAIRGLNPDRPEVLWNEVRVEALVNMSQALQQLVTALELLLQRKIISDTTARETLRQFQLFRRMKSPDQEARDAEDNLDMIEEEAKANARAQAKENGGTPAITGSRVGGGRNE